MSACSIHVPPFRQVPCLQKNESMKTEKRDRKFPVYCSCRKNFFDLASDFNFRRSRPTNIGRFTKQIHWDQVKRIFLQRKVYSVSRGGG